MPIVVTSTIDNFGSASATQTISLPSGTGGYLLTHIGNERSSTYTYDSGWEVIHNVGGNGSGQFHGIWDATSGDPSGTQLNFTANTSCTQVAQTWRVTGVEDPTGSNYSSSYSSGDIGIGSTDTPTISTEKPSGTATLGVAFIGFIQDNNDGPDSASTPFNTNWQDARNSGATRCTGGGSYYIPGSAISSISGTLLNGGADSAKWFTTWFYSLPPPTLEQEGFRFAPGGQDNAGESVYSGETHLRIILNSTGNTTEKTYKLQAGYSQIYYANVSPIVWRDLIE